MNIIGPKVRRIRQHLGLTQEQLVARCNLLGWNLSRGTLAKIESRVRKVTDYEVSFLSRALRIPEQDLFQED